MDRQSFAARKQGIPADLRILLTLVMSARVVCKGHVPIGWSGLIVSASRASGPLARCFQTRAVDSPERCVV